MRRKKKRLSILAEVHVYKSKGTRFYNYQLLYIARFYNYQLLYIVRFYNYWLL